MSVNGRAELHRFAQTVLGAFLLSLDDKARGSADMLTEPVKGFLASERCALLVDQFLQTLVQAVTTEINQERRADPFRRLLCHPLTELLESNQLPRGHLGNYFNFLHLVLGDSLEQMTSECEAVVKEIKQDPQFSWDMFYDDLRAKQLLWGVLMRVIETFKRFEPRRDWFISLMQNTPHAVSLGTHAFVALARDDEGDVPGFGIAEFNLLFGALFRPLLLLDPRDEAAFTQQFGAPPARLVLPLVEKLQAPDRH